MLKKYIGQLICGLFLLIPCFSHSNATNSFGNMAISEGLFNWIYKTLPHGSTILEMGSGYGSSRLAQHYTVYSVEHNKRWVGKYAGPHYIHASIKNRWYDVNVLKKMLPTKYDLILVDGPNGNIGRGGFLTNLDLFNTDGIIIIFDDIHRAAERTLMKRVAEALGRTPTYIDEDEKVGILFP